MWFMPHALGSGDEKNEPDLQSERPRLGSFRPDSRAGRSPAGVVQANRRSDTPAHGHTGARSHPGPVGLRDSRTRRRSPERRPAQTCPTTSMTKISAGVADCAGADPDAGVAGVAGTSTTAREPTRWPLSALARCSTFEPLTTSGPCPQVVWVFVPV